MKNTKIVFSGIMATILLASGANAAQIASKDYVDSQNTAQTTNILNTVNTTLQDYSTTTEVNTIVNDAVADVVAGDFVNKADKAVPAVAGNVAVLNATGNLADGGTLGTAAFTASTAYATAAQGTAADTIAATLTTNDTVTKANTALQSASLAGYATTTALTTGLAAKADTTTVNTALGLKADKTDLGALAAKDTVATADITDANVTKAKLAADVQTSLGKADTALQSAALDAYATTTALTTGLAAKADTTAVYTKGEVDTAMNLKADASALTGKEDTTNKSTSISTDTGSTTKYTTVSAVEGYALPKPPAACQYATNQCVLSVEKTSGNIYWEIVVMP